MEDDKESDKVPEGVPDPSGDVLQCRPCLECSCIGLNSLGCLGMSHSTVVTESISSAQVREKPREHSAREKVRNKHFSL